ncbi:MAG: redoxin domain-containing protein [Blautia sp.]|nr:redoxin domain-containing protein [Blautia sp.]
MGFDINVQVSILTVFVQGLLSFFSPCVLPLVPLYIGYLSGSAKDGEVRRGKVLLNTFFFVLGIGMAFFLLGIGATAAGKLFSDHRLLISRIGGVLVILLGLYQLGLFGMTGLFSSEKRLPVRFDRMAMSPVTAFLMGFVFSFAWTPCVGPVLTSVLMMAASAGSQGTGLFMILVYTIGFSLPFLLAGAFAGTVLAAFRKHRGILKYTTKIGGILLLVMGILMLTGTMNTVSGYFANLGTTSQTEEPLEEEAADEKTGAAENAGEAEAAEEQNTAEGTAESEKSEEESSPESRRGTVPATDFVLEDQYGEIHQLSDYKGKIVFLNFWATWCPPCRAEMPDIQTLYEETQADPDSDLVILGVAAPDYGQEKSREGIAAFLEENGYTYPTVMMENQSLYYNYGISAFPTTYMIDKNGMIYGYVTGSLTMDIMREIIELTRSGETESK